MRQDDWFRSWYYRSCDASQKAMALTFPFPCKQRRRPGGVRGPSVSTCHSKRPRRRVHSLAAAACARCAHASARARVCSTHLDARARAHWSCHLALPVPAHPHTASQRRSTHAAPLTRGARVYWCRGLECSAQARASPAASRGGRPSSFFRVTFDIPAGNVRRKHVFKIPTLHHHHRCALAANL